jgi:ribose-phosphate pyrophosphokinase
MNSDHCAIFALNATRSFGEQVCAYLNTSLDAHEEREFEDGEHKTRPLVNVRDKDVFVIQSLYGDGKQSVNDKLCRLLFFLGALRDASAGRVTAVMPYLCYARKDRKSKPRDPITTRYVTAMFESIGVDRVVTLDVHNLAAFQNAWRIPADHLEARRLFVNHFQSLVSGQEIVVVSPDVGGVKRAEELRQSLQRTHGREIRSAFIEKYRSAGVVSGDAVIGDVADRIAIIVDDLISSGTTLVRAGEACRMRGAISVYAAATHGVFSSKANESLSNPALNHIVITNSVPPRPLNIDAFQAKLTVLDTAGLFAEAIGRLHTGGSIVDLLEG